MSIYLTGVTFANQRVTPGDDGAVYAALSDGVLSGLAISSVGATLHLEPGKVLAGGRNMRLAAATDITVDGASSGYARLLLTVDLSRTATATVFEQARLDVEYSSSINGFSALTQTDINGSGTVYQIVVCLMELSAGGISAILWKCGKAGPHGVSVPLSAAGWMNNSQTVYVDGVTANRLVRVSYAPASKSDYENSGIWCSAQADGTLTFSCDSTPANAVTANCILM